VTRDAADPARAKRLARVPFVGLVVLLVRWLKEPRALAEEQRQRERMELTEAWIMTLATLLGLMLLWLLVAVYRQG